MARWIWYPFDPFTPYQDPSWWAVHLETKLFYIAAGLAPLIFIVMIFSWLIIPLRRYLGHVRVRVGIGRWAMKLGGRMTNSK